MMEQAVKIPKWEIIARYEAGESIYSLSKQLGISELFIINKLNTDSQPKREKIFFSFMEKEGTARYAGGEAATSIAKETGFDVTRILKYIRKKNIPVRNFADCHDSHRCAIDHTAFDKITEEAAYFGGYLFADGTVTKSKYADEIKIVLSLSVKDRAMVERFQKFLKTDYAINDNHSVKNGKISYMCRLGFQSKRIGAVLESWGVDDEKSNRGPTEIIAHNKDFIRGLLDGDGGLVAKDDIRAYRIYLVGNIPTLEVFKNFVENDLKQRASNITKTHSPKCWQIQVNGRYAKEVCKALWGNATIYLERKKILAQKIIDHDFTRKRRVENPELTGVNGVV